MRALHSRNDLLPCLATLVSWSCATLLAACSRSGSEASLTTEDSVTRRHGAVVAVIYSAPPALYRDENGHVSGFMYDIEVELSRHLGIPFDFQPTSFENIITGVQSGKFDLGNGVDATLARQNVVDIVPLYRGSYSFLTLKDGGKQLGGDMSALCGLTLASVAGGSDGPTIDAQSTQCQASGRAAGATAAIRWHGERFARLEESQGRRHDCLRLVSAIARHAAHRPHFLRGANGGRREKRLAARSPARRRYQLDDRGRLVCTDIGALQRPDHRVVQCLPEPGSLNEPRCSGISLDDRPGSSLTGPTQRQWTPAQIASRPRLDLPNDSSMRISHEAVYQALYV